ncbi:hypothetical protein BH24PSE2_BH24PSE2_01010 [soil metagenome]
MEIGKYFDRRAGRPLSTPAREIVLLGGMLLIGVLLLPICTWVAGHLLLGPQEGGLGAVYVAVFAEAARARPAAWLFIASPYLFVQSARLAVRPFRDRDR